MKEKFYFTFGNDENFPYQYGFVEVLANDKNEAVEIYSNKFPFRDGLVNCSFIYNEQEFNSAKERVSEYNSGNAGLYKMELFNYCHETLYKSEEGICPCCGSDDLDYDSIEAEGNSVYYPWLCNNCGYSGKEVYNLDFVGHEDIFRFYQYLCGHS